MRRQMQYPTSKVRSHLICALLEINYHLVAESIDTDRATHTLSFAYHPTQPNIDVVLKGADGCTP